VWTGRRGGQLRGVEWLHGISPSPTSVCLVICFLNNKSSYQLPSDLRNTRVSHSDMTRSVLSPHVGLCPNPMIGFSTADAAMSASLWLALKLLPLAQTVERHESEKRMRPRAQFSNQQHLDYEISSVILGLGAMNLAGQNLLAHINCVLSKIPIFLGSRVYSRSRLAGFSGLKVHDNRALTPHETPLQIADYLGKLPSRVRFP